MDEERMAMTRIEQLLEDNLELAEENNRILRDLRRVGRWGFWLRLLLWAAVIILPFLLLRPIISTLIPGATSDGAGFSVFGLPNQEQLKDVLDAYQGE
jgi:hypothetical protein